MVGQCYANLECKVIDIKMAAKYNIFIREVLYAWITNPKKDHERFTIAVMGFLLLMGNSSSYPQKEIIAECVSTNTFKDS